jgi:aubergine-like protein
MGLLRQMMSKQGRVLYRVDSGLFSSEKAHSMIMGIELEKFKNGHLVSAVCTMDKHFSKVYNKFGFLTPSSKGKAKNDHSDKISNLVKKCVKKFAEKNGSLPKNVIIYRSGFGNSQYLKSQMITEADQIKTQLNTLTQSDDHCKLVFLIAKKLIPDRFFINNGDNNIENLPGGTIIPSKVTQKNEMEFFMMAQKVTEGTGRPTNYFQIVNESNLSKKDLYILTYYQTFNYSNWLGPVRVPGVCKYAEKQMQMMRGIVSLMKDPRNVKTLFPNKIFYL